MNKFISSIYLSKEKHHPPVDNQGKVNSCLSQAFTYIQMTNAVSRKKNSPKWNPSSMQSACFSPRFTYLLARSGPSDIYDFLKDHGCLTVDCCTFQKDSNGGSVEIEDDIPIKESVAWNVDLGEFKKALQYRITGHTTTSIHEHEPQDLINNIKKNLQNGNIVISTTKIENWLQTELSNDCGEYGKKGDYVIVASRRYIPNGHSFAIVGYDDNITVTFAGVSFRGAFLVTCGYGSTWMNRGYCWMLYDAIFQTSQYDIMNSSDIYMNKMFLTSFYENLRVFAPVHLSDKIHEIQDFVFTPVGKTEINGNVFPTYRIRNPINEKYLGLSIEGDLEYPKAGFLKNFHDAEVWGIVSYRDLCEWSAFEAEYDSSYEDCYWIFSVELYRKDSTSRCFLDSGLYFYNIGRIVGMSKFNNGKYPQAKSWIIENFSISHSFVSSLGICSKDENLPKHRTYSLRDFWFVDWKRDVVLGLPELMVDLELETVDRESFEVKMLRYDKKGKKESYIPAMFRVYHTKYVEAPDVMSFGGEINADKPETGYFTFQYSNLLSIPKGTTLEDYQWGIEIMSKNEHSVVVKKISLVNAKNEILATISMENGPVSIYKDAMTYIFET